MMRAVQVTGSKASPQMRLSDSVAAPTAEGSNVLIKVCAAGITADEATWPELYASTSRVPGHDVSGIVSAVGPDYDGPAGVGDDVFAMLGAATGQGAQAEYAVAAADEVAPKPAALSHAQAAALPIPALTAWEAVVERADVRPGARVLVTGASGAVGAMVVQLAARVVGAHVTGLAAPSNHGFVLGLGARHVLDYNDAAWHRSVTDVDAVFDTVGGETLARSCEAVKRDAIVVTVADPPPPWAAAQEEPARDDDGVRRLYFVVTSRRSTLAKVAALLDRGDVLPLPVKVFPAADALDAWAYARRRGREGKAVIDFSAGS